MHAAVLSFPVNQDVQKFIDASVHDIISARYAHQPFGAFGKCAMYAIVGAQVLTLLTGRQCEAVCGGQIMDCGGGRSMIIAPGRQEIRQARHLSDLRMYHCWIQVYLPDEVIFDPVVVDFSTRYDPQSAALFKIDFAAELQRDFIWCRLSDFDKPIPASLEPVYQRTGKRPAWLWRDARCEALLKQFQQDNAAQFAAITSAVLLNFVHRVETAMADSTTTTTSTSMTTSTFAAPAASEYSF